MKPFAYKTIFFVLLIIVIFLTFKNCEKDSMISDLEDNMEAVDFSNQKFKKEINDLNQEITTQKQVILTKDQAIKSGLLAYDELHKKYKKVKSKVVVVTETKFDTIKIPFEPDSSDVALPDFSKAFKYKEPDNWLSFGGTVTNQGITLDSLKIRNKYSILIADKRMGFFKKSKPSVILTNENPYTETIKMNNVQVKQIKPFYKKNWFWFGLGVISKTLIDTNL